MPHQPREIGAARVQHQVVVIAHLAIRQRPRIEAIHGLRDHLQLRQPVSVVTIDRLPSVTSGNDVVDRAGEFDAKGSGHGASLRGEEEKWKT